MNFKVLAKNAVEYAKRDGIVLDWTRESVLCVEKILIRYRAKYSGQTDAKWKLSSFSACYATYIGELMLQKGLKKRGFCTGKHSKSPGPIAIQWVQGFYPSNLLLIYYFCRKWKPIRCFGYCNASGG